MQGTADRDSLAHRGEPPPLLYLIEGVPVEVKREDGSIGGDVSWLIDSNDVDANDWLTVNQYTMIERYHIRIPDVVLIKAFLLP